MVQMNNSRTFVIADTHFAHKNLLEMVDDNGKLIRQFKSVEEMDQCMIQRWNETVRPNDKVYHLGDFSMKPSPLANILPKLNGHKKLIRGNHDIYRMKQYVGPNKFEQIYGVRAIAEIGVILSHIPIHPTSLSRWKWNVHGHLHHRRLDDSRYICVSVEQIDYRPVELEKLLLQRELDNDR